jgi:hypothetical protein
MTCFVLSDTEVWGAHVADAVAQHESLFVTEDGEATWRVTLKRSGSH